MATAKRAQSDRLWSVTVENTSKSWPESKYNLWILASTADSASRKARTFAKKNYGTGYYVSKIESEGTIDAF